MTKLLAIYIGDVYRAIRNVLAWKCTWKSHFSLASIITCSRVIISQDNFYRIVVAFSLKTLLITSEDDLWVAVAFEPSMENIH